MPAKGLTRELGAGATAEEICARTIRRLRELGARHVYVSTLPLTRAARTLAAIIELAR